jgi:serine O-acetyltransferase
MRGILNFFRDFGRIFKTLSKDLDMYIEKDPVAKNKWKAFFTSIPFHGLMAYRFANFFYRYKIYPVAYIIYVLSRILHSMDIHPAAYIEPGVVIDHGFGVVIGETASVGSGTLIYHGVTLGAKNVTTGKRHPIVGKNVMIGAGAKVLGHIYIGDESVIGANSVVLMDVPPKSLAVGVPAKIKKTNCPSSNYYDLNNTINSDFII